MRKALALVLCALGCASEQVAPPAAPAPTAVTGGAAHLLPVVALRWESQPPVVDETGPREEGAPVSLTAGDGTGLEISELSASAVVEDPLAFTELHFVFKNPSPQAIEGRFEITLPPGATISRFAMRQSYGWQEGEVVELQAARQAYEDFLHRRSDPALLEKQAGNRFQARVFPIPASGEKEIIFSYSQELTRARDPYRLYLRGLPRLGKLDVRVLYEKRDDAAATGRRSFEIHRTDFKPDHDFALTLPVPAPGVRGLRQDRLAVARLTPLTEAAPDPVRSLLVLFDTSASRALGFRAEVERLGHLVDALRQSAGPGLSITVACFDQDVELIYDGLASDLGQKELDRILERKALGASDLGKALHFAATYSPRGHARPARVLVVSDGVVTAGETEAAEYRGLVARLGKAGVERIDALLDGGIRDESLVQKLAVGGLLRDGVVLDGALSTAELAVRLNQRAVSGMKVRVPGSAWVWPSTLDGVQPGDQRVVYADVPEGQPFEVEVEGAGKTVRWPVAAGVVERPLLERAMVSAEIRRLMDQRGATEDPQARDDIKQRVVALSTRNRVLSDFTGLLILETDQDYARFNIDRRALANILTVGPVGVELFDRNKAALQVAADVPAAAPEPRNHAAKDDGDGVSDERSKSEYKKPVATNRPTDRAPPPPPSTPPATGAAPAPRRSPEPPLPSPKKADSSVSGHLVPPSLSPSPPPPPPPPAPPPPASPREEHQRANAYDSADGASVGRRQSSARPAPARPRPPRGEATPGPLSAHRISPATEPEENQRPPYAGTFATVMDLVATKRPKEALTLALRWHGEEPGDVLALVALGESYEALGQKHEAARAYGSIIDLFPARADLRRFAGARLAKLGTGLDGAFDLVLDTYRQAVVERPDHPASHRYFAYALARVGRFEEAFMALLAGARRGYPPDRFAGIERIFGDDLGILAAAWIRAQPARRQEILDRLAQLRVPLATKPSLRFVLTWETDANDVDFHIRDARGGHAFYAQRGLPSGGELYADVTTGYGPECFTIEGRPAAFPYRLFAHYYSRGPMGYGMGDLEILEHDGRGGLKFDERPYVVMTDQAFVNLGTVTGSLPAPR